MNTNTNNRNNRVIVAKIATIVEDVNFSKSAKIRALNELKISRSEIAKLLDIRYQFVRNVLEKEIEKGKKNS